MSKSKINPRIRNLSCQPGDRRIVWRVPDAAAGQRTSECDDAPGIDFYKAYLSERWPLFAAIAWREFHEHGRGAVFVNLDHPDEDAVYVPMHMLSNPTLAPCGELVAEYDPDSEIVVIFLSLTRGVAMFKGDGGEGQLTPPEAHNRIGSLLFEN